VQRTVHTPDGRLLGVEDRGDPAGRPVLVHHGTPSSRLVIRYGPYVPDAAERGLRLIRYDRPGYGESSPQPGHSVADTATDVRTICAELGIDRLATWGHSSGGRHVLACAALLPDLVTAAAAFGSPAPFDADGLDHFARHGPGQRRREALVPHRRGRGQEEAGPRPGADPGRVTGGRGEELESSLRQDDAGPPGRLRRIPRVLPVLHASRPGAEQRGMVGRQLPAQAVGFDLGGIAVPVLLLYGVRTCSCRPANG
jgi:pimeloyl-ACP methyl ester carboxylesterase